MTRDELIAKVYELCGWIVGQGHGDHWIRRPDAMVMFSFRASEVGLDRFVSDIVPVLNKRGWAMGLPRQWYNVGDGKPADPAWYATAFSVRTTATRNSTDPIEAAFAVALEVLGD